MLNVILKVAMHLQLLQWLGKWLDTHTQTTQPFTYLESKISFSLLSFRCSSCNAYTKIRKANKYLAIYCLQSLVTKTIGMQPPKKWLLSYMFYIWSLDMSFLLLFIWANLNLALFKILSNIMIVTNYSAYPFKKCDKH
jgi:hypothetical protein